MRRFDTFAAKLGVPKIDSQESKSDNIVTFNEPTFVNIQSSLESSPTKALVRFPGWLFVAGFDIPIGSPKKQMRVLIIEDEPKTVFRSFLGEFNDVGLNHLSGLHTMIWISS